MFVFIWKGLETGNYMGKESWRFWGGVTKKWGNLYHMSEMCIGISNGYSVFSADSYIVGDSNKRKIIEKNSHLVPRKELVQGS